MLLLTVDHVSTGTAGWLDAMVLMLLLLLYYTYAKLGNPTIRPGDVDGSMYYDGLPAGTVLV